MNKLGIKVTDLKILQCLFHNGIMLDIDQKSAHLLNTIYTPQKTLFLKFARRNYENGYILVQQNRTAQSRIIWRNLLTDLEMAEQCSGWKIGVFSLYLQKSKQRII